MTFQIIFSVEGNPVGKQRPRFARGRTYTPKKTVEYEKLIADKAREAMGASEPLSTPVAVYLYVNMTVPRSYSKSRLQACLSGLERPIKKVGDLDNQIKSVLDGMNGVVYVDDCQVVSIHATKRYETISSIHVCVREELP
jgi:Holliday junction resolvase RusA-like endonuclease